VGAVGIGGVQLVRSDASRGPGDERGESAGSWVRCTGVRWNSSSSVRRRCALAGRRLIFCTFGAITRKEYLFMNQIQEQCEAHAWRVRCEPSPSLC
jgi:hypothetical protein